MRLALVIGSAIALGACSSGAAAPAAGTCERARDHALANLEVYVAQVVSASAVGDRPAIREQGQRESRLLAGRFVRECRALGAAFRPACFESPATEQADDCRPFVDELYRRTLR